MERIDDDRLCVPELNLFLFFVFLVLFFVFACLLLCYCWTVYLVYIYGILSTAKRTYKLLA